MSHLIVSEKPRQFDESACHECGLGYVENSPSDLAHHRDVHDPAVNGAMIARPADRHRIAIREDIEIFLTGGSAFGLDLDALVEAARTARYLDTPFNFGPFERDEIERGAVSAVCARSSKSNRIYGLLALDHGIESGWRLQRSNILRCLSGEGWRRAHCSVTTPPKMGVGFAWVLRNRRGLGLAQIMLQAAMNVYGERFDTIGFQFPLTRVGAAALYAIAGRLGYEDICVYSH